MIYKGIYMLKTRYIICYDDTETARQGSLILHEMQEKEKKKAFLFLPRAKQRFFLGVVIAPGRRRHSISSASPNLTTLPKNIAICLAEPARGKNTRFGLALLTISLLNCF